jgi:hypothetical protein
MTTDPMALAVWHALDVCCALAAAHVGAPVAVSDIRATVRHPRRPIYAGDALVDLVVLSDGVMVVSEVRGREALGAVHVPYPTVGGTSVPDPVAVFSRSWYEALDSVLSTALARLPEQGAAVA